MKHIPNILSCIRLLLIGVFILFFVKEKYIISLVVFTVAFITDVLDGYLARRNNWITDVGKVLDPLADKLMLLTALTCFYIRGWIPLIILILVAAKELTMIIGGLLLYKKNVVVYSDWFGKAAAGFFTAGVVLTLLKSVWPWIGIGNIIVFAAAIAAAIIALVHYAKKQVFVKKDR